LTDGGGPYDDYEPCWLPDGGLVFVSSRCKRWVNCWLTQVAILHRCDRDGRNVQVVSANIEHDNTPWVLSDGRNNPKSNYGPRALGSSASRILGKIDGSHHGVKATPEQERTLRIWIDSGAAYPGTYAALGSGTIGAYAENKPVEVDTEWPTTRAGAEVLQRRCVACHTDPARVLPLSLSDERGLSFWRPDWKDPRLNTTRHIVFNLTRPEKSLVLLAPLAPGAGGWGLCKDPKTGQPAPATAALAP